MKLSNSSKKKKEDFFFFSEVSFFLILFVISLVLSKIFVLKAFEFAFKSDVINSISNESQTFLSFLFLFYYFFLLLAILSSLVVIDRSIKKIRLKERSKPSERKIFNIFSIVRFGIAILLLVVFVNSDSEYLFSHFSKKRLLETIENSQSFQERFFFVLEKNFDLCCCRNSKCSKSRIDRSFFLDRKTKTICFLIKKKKANSFFEVKDDFSVFDFEKALFRLVEKYDFSSLYSKKKTKFLFLDDKKLIKLRLLAEKVFDQIILDNFEKQLKKIDFEAEEKKFRSYI